MIRNRAKIAIPSEFVISFVPSAENAQTSETVFACTAQNEVKHLTSHFLSKPNLVHRTWSAERD